MKMLRHVMLKGQSTKTRFIAYFRSLIPSLGSSIIITGIEGHGQWHGNTIDVRKHRKCLNGLMVLQVDCV